MLKRRKIVGTPPFLYATPPLFRCFVSKWAKKGIRKELVKGCLSYKTPSRAYTRPCWSVATTARRVHKKRGGDLNKYRFLKENVAV